MVITIFRSRINPQAQQECTQLLERMNELAKTMPGYLSHKGFGAQDGERVIIVEFESEQTQQAFSRHPEHVAAIKRGRSDFFLEYSVHVCSVLRSSTLSDKIHSLASAPDNDMNTEGQVPLKASMVSARNPTP